MERLFRKIGMGQGPEPGLGGLLASLLASKMMRGGSCGDPEGAEGRNCEECPMQGSCPLEALKGAMGGGTNGLKSADLMLSEAKFAGAKAQVDHLENTVSALRDKIDKMATAHTAEMERLASRHKAETDSLSQTLSDQRKEFSEGRNRNRQAHIELSERLQAAQEKINTALMVISSVGHGRPSRKILAEIRKALEMPPKEV